MTAVRTILHSLPSDSAGAAAIEYALIASLIAVAALGGIVALGSGTANIWAQIANAV